jgi:hypothetical protein
VVSVCGVLARRVASGNETRKRNRTSSSSSKTKEKQNFSAGGQEQLLSSWNKQGLFLLE